MTSEARYIVITKVQYERGYDIYDKDLLDAVKTGVRYQLIRWTPEGHAVVVDPRK